MIIITLEDTTPVIKIRGVKFLEIVDFLKDHLFKYSGKKWTASPTKVWNFIPLFKEIDDVQISTEDMEKLKSLTIEKSTIKRVRRKLNPDLLYHTPLPNKNGSGSFQIDDIISGIRVNRYAYYLEQSMGKSFIVMSVFNHLYVEGCIDRLLIVCEGAGVGNWKRYVKQYSQGRISDSDIYLVSTKNRTPFKSGCKLVLMTYRNFVMLQDDCTKVQNPRKPVIDFSSWGKPENRMIVLDESQNIGNWVSKQTHSIILHRHEFNYRYILSGTPALNGFSRYFSQMKFLDDAILPYYNYHEFVEDVCIVGTKFSKWAIADYKPEKVLETLEKMSPYVIFRKVDDYIDLPDNVVDKIYLDLSSKQKAIYQAIITHTLQVLKETEGVLRPRSVINKFPYLHQALDNPQLLKKGLDQENNANLVKMIDRFKFNDNEKVNITEDLLRKYIDEEGRKVVIWSGHPLSIEMLAEYFKRYNPDFIHGELNIPKNTTEAVYRDEIIEKFKYDTDKHLIILSYITSGTSINLTEANRAIYFDRSYNAVHYDQSLKRQRRPGQTERVISHPLIFENTLDIHLDANLSDKEKKDWLVQYRDSLSKEEWKSLFEGLTIS